MNYFKTQFVTFREFLNENLGQEELYFYLFCRNALFKGSQLEMSQSTFEIINYITFNEAEQFLRSTMIKFDANIVDQLILQLRGKIVVKVKNNLIDVQLVLRLLLEYLRTDKIYRYRLIKTLFYSQKCEDKKGVFSLNFQSFKKIFEGNFSNTTELEKAQIFRQCFCVGKGVVNHDSFFVVCNENGFFIKQLKLLLPEKFPVYNIENKQFEPIQTLLSQNLDQFQKFFRDENTQKTLHMVENYISSQGLELQLQKFELFLKQSNEHNEAMSIYDLKGRNFLLYLSDNLREILSCIMLKFLHKQNFLDKQHTIIVQNNIQQSFIQNFTQIGIILDNQKRDKYTQFSKNIVKIQRWAKRKISKWYELLNAILLNKLSAQLNKKIVNSQSKMVESIVVEEYDKEQDGQNENIRQNSSKKHLKQ